MTLSDLSHEAREAGEPTLSQGIGLVLWVWIVAWMAGVMLP